MMKETKSSDQEFTLESETVGSSALDSLVDAASSQVLPGKNIRKAGSRIVNQRVSVKERELLRKVMSMNNHVTQKDAFFDALVHEEQCILGQLADVDIVPSMKSAVSDLNEGIRMDRQLLRRLNDLFEAHSWGMKCFHMLANSRKN